MTTIKDLPSDILTLIFSVYYSNIIQQADSHTHHELMHKFQPLTAVCRMWRENSLYLFYRDIVFEYKKILRGSEDTSGSTDALNITREWVTNASLAARLGFVHYARRVKLTLRVNDQSVSDIYKVLKESGFDLVEWPTVTTFEYSNWAVSGTTMYSVQPESNPHSVILSDYLCWKLPGLKKFYYYSMETESTRNFPFDTFILKMGSRLEVVDVYTGSTPDFGQELILPQLTNLSVNSGSAGQETTVPRTYANKLRTLDLVVKVQGFYWDRFIHKNSISRDIEFTNLKSLSIRFNLLDYEFTDQPPDISLFCDQSKRSIWFPQLAQLKVKYCPYDISQMISLFYSPMLVSLDINNCFTGVCRIDHKVLARLEHLCISWRHSNDLDLIEGDLKNIHRNATNLKTLYLYLPLHTMYYPPESVCWNTLTKLILISPTCIYTLSQLLPKLTNLVILHVLVGRHFDGETTRIGQPVSKEIIDTVVPISMSIRTLTVSRPAFILPNPQLTKDICTFITMIPSLKKLFIDELIHETILRDIRDRSIESRIFGRDTNKDIDGLWIQNI